MSVSLKVTAYSSTENTEFQKHFNAVKFCIENDLSFPKETSEFFKGKLGGSDLEDIKKDCIIEYIQNGIEVGLNLTTNKWGTEIKINVADIPAEVDLLIIKVQ